MTHHRSSQHPRHRSVSRCDQRQARSGETYRKPRVDRGVVGPRRLRRRGGGGACPRRVTGADSGIRTRIDGMEARRPTLGRARILPEPPAHQPGNRASASGPARVSERTHWPNGLHRPGAVKGNRTPVASLARSHSTIELPPQNWRRGACPRRVTERTAGVEPASAGWDPAILTVGRCPQYRDLEELLAGIAPTIPCIPNRCPAIWA